MNDSSSAGWVYVFHIDAERSRVSSNSKIIKVKWITKYDRDLNG